MGTTYTGNDATIAPHAAAAATIPADTDLIAAETFNVTFRKILDYLDFLQTHAALLGEVNTFSAAQKISAGDLELTAGVAQAVLKATGGKLQVGTKATNNADVELVVNGVAKAVIRASDGRLGGLSDPVNAQDADTKAARDAALAAMLPTGTVLAYAGVAAPAGFVLCNGALVSRTTYAALFAAIGVTYGVGDGITTFQLPDLRGRAAVGAGQGAGLTNRALAAAGGAETHVLQGTEMPSHSHSTFNINGSNSDNGDPGPYVVTSGVEPNGVQTVGGSTGSAGGDQPHNNMQPFLALNYVIKT